MSNYTKSMLNGVVATLMTREEAIVDALCEKFDLDKDEVMAVISEVDKASPKSSKSRKTAATGSKSTGTRRMTGYILFSKENRKEFQDEVTPKTKYTDKDGNKFKVEFDDKGKVKMTELTKYIGYKWRQLSDKEREEYNERAKDMPVETSKSKKSTKKGAKKKTTTKKGAKKTKKKSKAVVDSDDDVVVGSSDEE